MKRTALRRKSVLSRSSSLRSQGPGKRKKSARYKAFLSSGAWKALRQRKFQDAGWLCNRCEAWCWDGDHRYTDPYDLERRPAHVHHVSYVRFGGGERMADLEVLCDSCHRAHHEQADWFKSKRRA